MGYQILIVFNWHGHTQTDESTLMQSIRMIKIISSIPQHVGSYIPHFWHTKSFWPAFSQGNQRNCNWIRNSEHSTVTTGRQQLSMFYCKRLTSWHTDPRMLGSLAESILPTSHVITLVTGSNEYLPWVVVSVTFSTDLGNGISRMIFSTFATTTWEVQ